MARSKKKASLELSINAIVVLILAITVLGLGLGFVTKMFGSTTSRFDSVSGDIKTAMIEELETSGQLVTLKNPKFVVDSGEPTEFYFGIRNNLPDNAGSKTCFYFQFYCIDTLKNLACPTDTDKNWAEFFTTYSSIDLKQGESTALYADLMATGSSETYSGRLFVWTSQGVNCVVPTYNSNPLATGIPMTGSALYSLYDSKDFFVEVQ